MLSAYSNPTQQKRCTPNDPQNIQLNIQSKTKHYSTRGKDYSSEFFRVHAAQGFTVITKYTRWHNNVSDRWCGYFCFSIDKSYSKPELKISQPPTKTENNSTDWLTASCACYAVTVDNGCYKLSPQTIEDNICHSHCWLCWHHEYLIWKWLTTVVC